MRTPQERDSIFSRKTLNELYSQYSLVQLLFQVIEQQ